VTQPINSNIVAREPISSIDGRRTEAWRNYFLLSSKPFAHRYPRTKPKLPGKGIIAAEKQPAYLQKRPEAVVSLKGVFGSG
jgi:hypothetical protein